MTPPQLKGTVLAVQKTKTPPIITMAAFREWRVAPPLRGDSRASVKLLRQRRRPQTGGAQTGDLIFYSEFFALEASQCWLIGHRPMDFDVDLFL